MENFCHSAWLQISPTLFKLVCSDSAIDTAVPEYFVDVGKSIRDMQIGIDRSYSLDGTDLKENELDPNTQLGEWVLLRA